ncbi:MAG: MarR family transcriptional regulator [Dehalococcoidia bacterium]|nr:MarR family transcriptional regulator [Dehalococcoidia bacterium]
MDELVVQRAMRAYGAALAVVDPIRLRYWDSRGLTTSQLRLMFMLRESGPTSVGDLAQVMGVRPATMTGFIGRLVRQQLAQRLLDDSDRRVVLAALTDEGREALGELEVAARAYLRRVLQALGPDQVAAFAESLEAFGAAARSLDNGADDL